MPYKSLDPGKIERTVRELHADIATRFGGRGLEKVCGELLELAHKAGAESAAIGRRNWYVAGGAVVLSAAIVALVIGSALQARLTDGPLVFSDYLQALESGINDVLLTGAAIWFLFTFEQRLKRRRTLNAIHELRAIAHIIDMHQLAKNPAGHGGALAVEDPEQLRRYFQYCSAMLSLTGKVAALYVQKFNDGETLAAVNEVEDLTTGLSRKIWQKMTVLEQGQET